MSGPLTMTLTAMTMMMTINWPKGKNCAPSSLSSSNSSSSSSTRSSNSSSSSSSSNSSSSSSEDENNDNNDSTNTGFDDEKETEAPACGSPSAAPASAHKPRAQVTPDSKSEAAGHNDGVKPRKRAGFSYKVTYPCWFS